MVGWLVGFYGMSTLAELFYAKVNLTIMVSDLMVQKVSHFKQVCTSLSQVDLFDP